MIRIRTRTRSRSGGSALFVLIPVLALAGCSRGAADAAEPTPAAANAAATPAPTVASAPAVALAAPGVAPTAAPTGASAADERLAPEQIPLVVARLGSLEISRADLLARAAEARGALAERGVRQPPSTRGFYRSVLDDIIGNRLLYRDLVARGLGAPTAEVEKRVQEVRSRYPSEEEFERVLEARGFDVVRLRAEIAEGVTVQRWLQETVIPALVVTPEMTKQFYDDNAEQMIAPEAVRLSHVLVAVPRDADDAARDGARQKAEALRARIAGGEDLAAVARESSDDQGSAERGGDVGWLQRGQAVPAFEQAAFALAPGELSPVVETPFGFHVLRVAETRAEKQLSLDEAREQIENLLKQRLLENEVRDTIQGLAKNEKIEVLI